MNQYQRLSAFLLRVIGGVLLISAVAGPVTIALLCAFRRPITAYPPERWAACVVWAVAGTTLILASKRLGRLLGAGLD